MKTISVGMAAHIASETSTLTSLWVITRTDGVTFRYTELDRNVSFEGKTYKSAAGFNKSAVSSNATLATDELQVMGFLSDDDITDVEMRNGAFDFAEVEVFLVNYEDESMGKIALRRGYFGEVVTTSTGAFSVELRGLVDLFQQKIGDTYLPECRADLGDSKCGIVLQPARRKAGTRYKLNDRVLYPVAGPGTFEERHYPDIVDPDMSTWTNANLMIEDDNMSPRSSGTTNVVFCENGQTTLTIQTSALDLSPSEISAANLRVTVTGYYYLYWNDSSGYIELQNMSSSVTVVSTSTTDLPNLVPEKAWREFSVSVNLTSNTDRIRIILHSDPNGDNSYNRICATDFDITVEEQNRTTFGFEKFGGVEYKCVTAGKTTTGTPTFTDVIDDVIADGSAEWKVVVPRYKFLGEINDTSSNARILKADVISADADWFGWGIVLFLTGDNAGRAIEISGYNESNGNITLAFPMPYQAQIGDLFSIQAGCNKKRTTCIDKFSNIINFRGHPRVPGQGYYFKVAGT